MEIKKKISQAEFQRLRRIVMSVDILVIGSLFFWLWRLSTAQLLTKLYFKR